MRRIAVNRLIVLLMLFTMVFMTSNSVLATISNTMDSDVNARTFRLPEKYELGSLKFRYFAGETDVDDTSITIMDKAAGRYLILQMNSEVDYTGHSYLEKINILMAESPHFVKRSKEVLSDYRSGKMVNVLNNPASISTCSFKLDNDSGQGGLLLFYSGGRMYVATYLDKNMDDAGISEFLQFFADDITRYSEELAKEEAIKNNRDSQGQYTSSVPDFKGERTIKEIINLSIEDMSFREYNKHGLNLKKVGEFKNMQLYYPSQWNFETNDGTGYFSKEGQYSMDQGGMAVYVDDNRLNTEEFSREQLRDRLLDLAQESLESYRLSIGYFSNPKEISILDNTGGLIIGPYTSATSEGCVAALSFLSNERPATISFVLPDFTEEEAFGFIKAFSAGLEYSHTSLEGE